MTATDQKHIEDLGFTVDLFTLDIEGAAAGVVSYGHIYKHGHRQVAVYRATREDDFFGWGWVEIPNGRRDVHTWADFLFALSASTRGLTTAREEGERVHGLATHR